MCIYIYILSLPSLHGFHSFLFLSPFLYSFASSQQGSIPQLLTEIDLICLLQRGHTLRCANQLLTMMCFTMYFLQYPKFKNKDYVDLSLFFIILAALTCTPHVLICSLPALFFARQVRELTA